MLELLFKPHRVHLRSDTAEAQKLFAMLRVLPAAALMHVRPPLAFGLVIDTSGSMHNTALVSKLDQAIHAAHALVDEPSLLPDDLVTIIACDTDAHELLPLSPLLDRTEAHAAIEALRRFSGQTMLARGLQMAHDSLRSLSPLVARRLILLTDGQTADESECRHLGALMGEINVPTVAIGVGPSYNEILLRDLADLSRGRPYHLDDLVQLRELLQAEAHTSSREVVRDVVARFETVRGVRLDSLTRVYPSLGEVTLQNNLARIGNIARGDFTIFALEFTVEGMNRPAGRARLARLSLRGHASSGASNSIAKMGDPFETSPHDVIVGFTSDEAALCDVDPEVLGYVQQKNIDGMVDRAMRAGEDDRESARQQLQGALAMSRRLNNPAVTRMLQGAVEEWEKTGKLSAGTRKSIMLNPRTKTVKIGASGGGAEVGVVPSDEEIRRLTGA